MREALIEVVLSSGWLFIVVFILAVAWALGSKLMGAVIRFIVNFIKWQIFKHRK